MSAALQFPTIARAAAAQRRWQTTGRFATEPQPQTPDSDYTARGFGPARLLPEAALHGHREWEQPVGRPAPPPNMAFYRRHTESLLRRYLLASMLVGRSPALFQEHIVRGYSSNRPVHSFEDCVIFVIDVEKALSQVSALDRLLLNRLVLQEYTIPETALLLNKSQRIIGLRLADALDRLTGILIDNGTLKIPNRRHPKPEEDFED
jgi:hypothetical protein